jgi:hypothetical protein
MGSAGLVISLKFSELFTIGHSPLTDLFTIYVQYFPGAASNFLQLFFWRTFVGSRR